MIKHLMTIWILFILPFPLTAMAIEEPKFNLLEKSDAFELREYKPVIVAEVLVEGDLDEVSNKGFRLIADYIFGNNRAQSGASEKIAMTAPVTVEPKTEKIAMTAPVTVEPKTEKIAMTAPVTVQQGSGKWRVYFVMPSQYTLETLPTPNNPKVMLREVPSRKVAVVRFSGLAGESKTASKTKELLAWLATRQLKPISTPELARYNPPWTLPFLRRNEVMVEYN